MTETYTIVMRDSYGAGLDDGELSVAGVGGGEVRGLGATECGLESGGDLSGQMTTPATG